MTVKEYIRRKNKIIFDVTGRVLVPESQIVEVDMGDYNKIDYSNNDLIRLYGDICLYCIVFSVQDNTTDERCFSDYNEHSECPMSLAGNRCLENNESTWWKASQSWQKNATEEDINQLEFLIMEYNDTVGDSNG